jgi:serine/threonine-protein kinase
MGEVWRAYDTVTERVVALKLLKSEFHDDTTYEERFRRECRAAARLDEPHVVPIHDFGEIDGSLFVTMRLIQGHDLEHVLREGPLPAARAVGIIEQVASALHAAHSIGLVHRDVKPSNILIGDDDFSYLIDFGIARAVSESTLTSHGAIGTWAYMSPERFDGVADARADVYALACVLYQALTTQTPYRTSSIEQIVGAHLREPPPRPSAVRPELPTQLDDVIAIGMAKKPDDRYSTTKDLARAARAALTAPNPTADPVAARPVDPVPPPTRPASDPRTFPPPPETRWPPETHRAPESPWIPETHRAPETPWTPQTHLAQGPPPDPTAVRAPYVNQGEPTGSANPARAANLRRLRLGLIILAAVVFAAYLMFLVIGDPSSSTDPSPGPTTSFRPTPSPTPTPTPSPTFPIDPTLTFPTVTRPSPTTRIPPTTTTPPWYGDR